MTPQPQQYKITDDLSKVKMLDWVEGIGYITTYYELKFIHRFAEATRSRPLSDELKKERERVLDKYLELLVSCRFELDGEIVVKMGAIRNVREELRGEP